MPPNRNALVREAQGRVEISGELKDEFRFTQRILRLLAPHISIPMHKLGTSPADPKNLNAATVKDLTKVAAENCKKLKDFLGQQRFEDAILLASEFLSSLRNVDQDSKFLNSAEITYFHVRAVSFLALGQGKLAIDDTTAALKLISSFMKIYPNNGQPDFKFCNQLLDLKTRQSNALLLRAQIADNLGDLEGALVDMRAAIAIEVEMGRNLTGIPIQREALILLARMKAGSPRPHFTVEEIRAWNKELQIKEYSPKNRLCSNCGVHRSANAKLKLCGDCKQAWFCGTQCQRISWPLHKLHCRNPLKKVTVIPIEEENMHRSEIASKGYSTVEDDASSETAVLLCDVLTGAIYESLSNQDVVFVTDSEDMSAVQEQILYYHCTRGVDC